MKKDPERFTIRFSSKVPNECTSMGFLNSYDERSKASFIADAICYFLAQYTEKELRLLYPFLNDFQISTILSVHKLHSARSNVLNVKESINHSTYETGIQIAGNQDGIHSEHSSYDIKEDDAILTAALAAFSA